MILLVFQQWEQGQKRPVGAAKRLLDCFLLSCPLSFFFLQFCQFQGAELGLCNLFE